MNDQFISKELALWLKERGCEIGGGACLLLDCNELCREEDLGDYRIGVDAVRTYSWYDILATHAKEFWGEQPETIAETPAHRWWPMLLIDPLQEGRFVFAEQFVREHSLFANS